MDKKNLVSIIMPAYNSSKYIEEAINSVLVQTHQNWELIVIDDRSSDDTVIKIKSCFKADQRIKLYQLKNNKGCAFARNIGLEKAQGEYIAFLDSDDFWKADKLEKQIKAINKYSRTIWYTAGEIVDSEGKINKQRHAEKELTFIDMLKNNGVIFSTVLCRAEDIENIKFKSGWYHEDYIFLLDCLKKGLEIRGIDTELGSYRVHNDGRSFNKINAAINRWNIYRNYLKLNLLESIYYFTFYAFNGVLKHI